MKRSPVGLPPPEAGRVLPDGDGKGASTPKKNACGKEPAIPLAAWYARQDSNLRPTDSKAGSSLFPYFSRLILIHPKILIFYYFIYFLGHYFFPNIPLESFLLSYFCAPYMNPFRRL